MPPPAANPANTPPKNFEEAMAELEKILADIERGDVSLEESLAKYQRGTLLIQHCRKVLADAERQVEILTRAPDGGIKTEAMPE
jgi:exodeoxyribonuclease VII small subunit